MRKIFLYVCFFMLSTLIYCQDKGISDHENAWTYRVFSIENFFNKFNGKLNLYNEVPDQIDDNTNQRIEAILFLINHENADIPEDSIKNFVLASLPENDSKELRFSDKNWYAEVIFSAKYKNKTENIKAILKFELADNEKQYWTLLGLSNKAIGNYLTENIRLNFPPNSHGNDFSSISRQMLSKLNSKDSVNYPHFLAVLKEGEVKISHVSSVSYHFFQVKDYYFTVNEFDRKEQLSGWLISKIQYLPEPQKSDEKKKILTIQNSS